MLAISTEMFIRWKRRKKAATKPWRRPRRRSDAGDSLYCVLVESQRINGSPRQKVVCYLGSLDEGDREKVWLRVDFWDEVLRKLDGLQLPPRDRKKIEESIARVVSRVPQQDAAVFKKERQKYREKKAQLFQMSSQRSARNPGMKQYSRRVSSQNSECPESFGAPACKEP